MRAEFTKRHGIKAGESVELGSIKTRQSGPFKDKGAARAYTARTVNEIRALQYRLYVEHRQSLSIVLQAPADPKRK